MLDGVPGLYSPCKKGDLGAIEAKISLADGSERTAWVLRETLVEQQYSAAMRLVTLQDSELFVCDYCALPARSVAIENGKACCGACARLQQVHRLGE